MAERIKETLLQSWSGGVKASEDTSWPNGATSQMAMDEVAEDASPRAWNNIFAVAGQRVLPRKREGCVTMNDVPVTGASAIIGQYDYRFRDPDTGNLSLYHLLVSENGRLDWMDTSGNVTTIDATAFTPGFNPPSFATLNNHCFMVNGVENWKLYQTTKQVFGIVRPEVTGVTVNAGVAGNFNGTYEVAFTFYNSVSGHESSLSDPTAEVTAAFTKIDITGIPTTSDSQVDTVYIYVRNVDTMTKFYKAGEVAEGTTTLSLNIDTVDTDLIIESPTIQSNNPPLSSVKYVAAHKSRLFAADDGKLYWSEVGDPESFDPNAWDYVNQNDGQKITGLASIPGGFLVIFKQDSYYVLEGDQPGVWAISKMGPSVGCISAQSIVQGADALYWWAEQGPVKLSFGNLAAPELIGHNNISASLTRRQLNYAERRRICGVFNLTGQRVLWAVPEVGFSRNTRILVWSSRLSVWESDRWDPLDVASLGSMDDSYEETFVAIGSYAGQVFKLGLGYTDGVPSGTTDDTFVAFDTSPFATLTTASTVHTTTTQVNVSAGNYTVAASDLGGVLLISGGTATAGYYTITAVDTGNNRWTLDRSAGTAGQTVAGTVSRANATMSVIPGSGFYNSNGKLTERKVTIVAADMTVVTAGIRPYIVSNTATTLTLSSPVSGLVAGATYTVIIGGPDWQFDTSWLDSASAFEKKRLIFVYLMAMLYGQTMYVDLLRNRKGYTLEIERFASVVGDGSLWNTPGLLWNGGTKWNDAEMTYDRIRGARTGVSFALRFRNPFPEQGMILLKAGLQCEMLDDKLG